MTTDTMSGGGAGSVLLATKLHAPALRHELVPRPGLLVGLRASRARRLTLVAAPAGWGKTSLVCTWRSADPRPFAWVSIDAADNDPVRFWTYVIEALRQVAPAVGPTALELLRSSGTTPVRDVLPGLLNELADLQGQIVLVLDDYHVIGNQDVHEGVAFLLEHSPTALHLVLATRSDPPLPLPRLRVRGEVVEIRADDLRFTEAETATLMNEVLELRLDNDEVARLQQRTEGWAAGLYLAALSLRGRRDTAGFVEAFAGDDRHIVDYLAAEVLEGLPGHIRAFLVSTSILERLCGPLCDTVSGRMDSGQILIDIERANLFLVPLDSRRYWYRYHHLFGELLRHELERHGPGHAAVLHARACDWYSDNGLIAEAIHHACAGGDVPRARQLVAEGWNTFFNRGELETVIGWLDALPSETVSADPELCFARAWIALDRGLLAEVGDWVEAAERAAVAQPVTDVALAGRTAILHAVHCFKVGDLGETRTALQRADELEPTAGVFWQTVACCMRGVAAWWSGRAEEAIDPLRTAVRLAEADGNDLAAIYALGYLAAIEAERGELDSAEGFAARATILSEAPGRSEHFVAMMAPLARGRVASQRGDLVAGERAIRRAVELAHRGAGRIEVGYALVAQAQLRQSLGDRETARRLLRAAERVIAEARDAGTIRTMLARTERALRAGPADGGPEELSEREHAILRLLPSELSQRAIADALFVSHNTVKTHLRGIYRKLDASTRDEAVTRARALGLL